MPPKAKTDDAPPSVGPGVSGKFVIIAILFVAFWAAGTSWYFRYTATRHALRFWGPATATLIRDAPAVFIDPAGKLDGLTSAAANANSNGTTIDVSQAPGLTHFRNALLEDHNFKWGTLDKELPREETDFWSLVFRDPKTGKSATVWVSDDFRYSASRDDDRRLHFVAHDTVMTSGLQEMFAEFTAKPAADASKAAPVPKQPASPAR